MQDNAYLKCINPQCGLEYQITSINVQCEKGHLLDVKYKNTPSDNLKELFYKRRNSQGNIFDESGVWRFRELLNFCQIDNRHIKYIIDKNPLKHQLLSPGSAIPIISFEKGIDDMKDTDTILLLAWNFEKEIIKKALIDLNLVKVDETDKLLKTAEEKERQSNQISHWHSI